ncbi:hypothetical protein [Lysinibacter cavernae]|uniref:Uncharacterized protein n=1 Tax=Lysinibacter cavernae TaxID=1640652 RepID=A0A7X5TT53_9MICO|nr:hypothetical protein [Lysinibacter cavernae]NIH52342.1 hypothetical protein [Lysinibacter cavernae]
MKTSLGRRRLLALCMVPLLFAGLWGVQQIGTSQSAYADKAAAGLASSTLEGLGSAPFVVEVQEQLGEWRKTASEKEAVNLYQASGAAFPVGIPGFAELTTVSLTYRLQAGGSSGYVTPSFAPAYTCNSACQETYPYLRFNVRLDNGANIATGVTLTEFNSLTTSSTPLLLPGVSHSITVDIYLDNNTPYRFDKQNVSLGMTLTAMSAANTS